MFASFRIGCALPLAGALVIGGAMPVLASDSVEEKALPQTNLAMAANAPVLPVVDAQLPPPVLADAAQTRPIDIVMPAVDTSFGAPAVRRSLYVSFGALQVLDAVSTRQALKAGGREANPAMTGIANNTAALYAVKAGTAVATTFLAERLAKKHPRRAAILMTVLNTAYVAIVAHNYRVARAR